MAKEDQTDLFGREEPEIVPPPPVIPKQTINYPSSVDVEIASCFRTRFDLLEKEIEDLKSDIKYLRTQDKLTCDILEDQQKSLEAHLIILNRLLKLPPGISLGSSN